VNVSKECLNGCNSGDPRSHFRRFSSVRAQPSLIKQNCEVTMDDLDLSDLLRFDLTSKDDRMQMMMSTVIIIVFLVHWPHTTIFITLLCLAQINLGFVPQDHDYWKRLATQAAANLILSMRLANLSERLVGYCWRNVRDACICIFKFLFVRSILHICRFVTRATARLVKDLASPPVAFNGEIPIPDDESDHGTFGDFHSESMYESETEPAFEVEHDSHVSKDKLQDLTNESKHEANEDASTITSTLDPDTTMTPSGLDQRSSRILRSGSQSSNARRIEDYWKKSIEESDDAKDAKDAHHTKGARNARKAKDANEQAAADDADADDRVKRAHFDDGSQAVTTDDSGLLWAYRLVRTKHKLKDAGGHKYSPTGFGYLRIPASTTMGFIMVGCWHTPSLPATIVSPSRICRDHNFRGFASVGLLDSNDSWVTLFHAKRTNADVTIGSHLRGGLLYSDPLIRPTAAQHANPLPKPVICVHRVAASDPDPAIDPAPPASPVSEPVVAPTEPPWSPPPCTCCATCSPCTSPAVDDDDKVDDEDKDDNAVETWTYRLRGKDDVDINTTLTTCYAENPFFWKRRYDTAASKDKTLATAAAKDTEAKLRRFKTSVQNSEGMFGSKPIVAAELGGSVQPRKRRLSEGALGLGSSTPIKGATADASPKAIPRANKRSKTKTAKSLSPLVVCCLQREAWMAKKRKASEISRLVEVKESELIAINCFNDILCSERDAAEDAFASSIATLR
jgi:hypothetical protein